MRNSLATAATAVAVTAAAVAATVTGATGAAAASTIDMLGTAGGSYVQALNSTITSDLTALSGVNTVNSSATSSNSTAGVTVKSVLTLGAVTTSTTISPISGGKQLVADVRTAGVNLLNGVITAKAVETVDTITYQNGVSSAEVHTNFVGLKIAGIKLPINLPKNFMISLPGVATVVINQSIAGAVGTTAEGIGNGIAVTLLRPRGNNQAGAAAYVSSTFAVVGDLSLPSTGHGIGGNAYATKVDAAVGTLASVRSDPTAIATVPYTGTDNGPVVNSTAAVNLSPALRIGAITDTATGTNTTAVGDAETTSKIASVNLLNGLIKADAITSDAHVRVPTGHTASVSGSSQLVNLVIAGRRIPINVRPNTVINIGSIATVTINQQQATPFSITVRALDITLLNARNGLPAGAEIQIATATAAAI